MGLIAEWRLLIAIGRRARFALAISLVSIPFSAAISHGDTTTITFSDLAATSGSLNSTTYGPNSEMPSGITATFTGLNVYSYADPNPLDHDHTGNTDWIAVYGNADPNNTGVPSYINFSAPVQVSSLWFDNYAGNYPADGSPAYGLEVVGLLSGSTVWTYSYVFTPEDISNGNPPDVFQQITSGANLTVNQLEFINDEDVAIDDITINTVPEPSCLGLLGLISAGLILQRRSRLSVK